MMSMSAHSLLPAATHGRVPRRVRFRAWWRGSDLDGQLAADVDPASSPELSARAAWLCSTLHRPALAAGVERVVDDAERVERGRGVARPARPPTVAAAHGELLAIAVQLRGPADLDPGGLALINRLVFDGDSPLHGGDAGRLLPLLAEIRAALEPASVT